MFVSGLEADTAEADVHGLMPELQMLHNQLVELLMSEALKWPVPRWPLYVFLAGAMVCMALSAACHGFACCGTHTNK